MVAWFIRQWQKIYNEYIISQEFWITIGLHVVKIFAIILIAALIIRFGKVMIRNVFKIRSKSPIRLSERRQTTLEKLLENVLAYVIYFIVLIMLLEVIHIPITSLLAGAGIVGLAIGFGAQNLVRDIITGFFIIFEDQFSVGDFIRTGNYEGFVEEIGLRTTKIKSFTGELHILPNGNIAEVTNFSVNNSLAIVDVSIAYEGNIPRAEEVLQDLLKHLPGKYEDMVKEPEILGVQTLGSSDVVIRIISEVKPLRHWHIARVLRKEIKLCFDENEIEIPFPRMVMYSRKEGELPKEEGSVSKQLDS